MEEKIHIKAVIEESTHTFLNESPDTFNLSGFEKS